MKESLKLMCENFTESYTDVKKNGGFLLLNHGFASVCAYLFAVAGKKPDIERIKTCSAFLKENTKKTHCFDDVLYPSTACFASLSGDPEKLIENAVENYKRLKKTHTFLNIKYPSLAALLLEMLEPSGNHEDKIKRSEVIYDCLKQRHKSATSSNDIVLTQLLAFSDKSVEDIMSEIEDFSEKIKFISSGEVSQLTALMLTYSDKPAKDKAANLKTLFDLIRTKKPKLHNSIDVLYLVVFSLLDEDYETIVKDIFEVFDELGERKGYKGFLATIDTYTRLIHSVLIVLADILSQKKQGIYELGIIAVFLAALYKYDKTQQAIAASNVVFYP